MAQLAIKGHPTRGKEVIQLLEMFGGKNSNNLKAIFKSYFYYIKDAIIDYMSYLEMAFTEDFETYTLEEFEEKFPYKVDDVVVNHKYGKGDITQMLWIDNEIVYEIHFEDCTAYCKANELCKYDAFKGLQLQELTEYLSHATREELDKTMEEIEIALASFKVGDKVIVKCFEKMGEDEVICVFKTYDGNIKYKTKNHLDAHYFMEDSFTRVEKINKEENMEERKYADLRLDVDQDDKLATEVTIDGNKIIPPKNYLIGKITKVDNGMLVEFVKKQSQYPKDYKECCKVLGYSGNYNMILTTDIDCKLFNALYRLKVCRDAYWKLAGEEMSLGKPWEPDWCNENKLKYCIECSFGTIDKTRSIVNGCLLAFPTAEMRDAFYENFKELIEQCKELL